MSNPSSAAAVLKPNWRWVITVFFLALAVRAVMLFYRLNIANIPLDRLGGSDVPGWMGMANHLTGGLDLSYWLMGARPPLYPALAALIFRLGGNMLAVAIVQLVLGALASTLGYLFARRLIFSVAGLSSPERTALISGVVIAVDPATVSSSATLMSEPLFNLLFIGFFFFLIRYVQQRHLLDLTLSALLMGLTMLSRATGIYLWLAAPFILIPFIRRWWQPALVLTGIGLAVYLGWSARNLQYTGVFTYSLQTNFSLLFLRALSAEHLATGRTTDELQVEYVRDLYQSVGDTEKASSPAPDDLWDFLVAESPQLYRNMGRMARQKLLEYWPHAITGTGIGVVRLLGWTQLLPRWLQPLEIVYHIGLYSLAILGGVQAYRRRDLFLLVSTLVPVFYISGLTLVAQTSAMDTRMRTSITAPLVILAVYGFTYLWRESRFYRTREVATR